MTESYITNFVNCTVVPAPEILSIFSASVTSVFSLIVTFGNFLVILAVIKDPNKNLRTPFNFFVVNLAIADLVVGLLTCPLAVVTHCLEAEGTFSQDLKSLRQSLHFSHFSSVSASLLNLAALCIDRAIAIRHPLRYRMGLSYWYHLISAVFIWVIAIAVSCVYFEIGYEEMSMIMAVAIVLLTFLVMILTILLLYCFVKRRDRNTSSDEGKHELAVIPLERINSRKRTRSGCNIRAAKTVLKIEDVSDQETMRSVSGEHQNDRFRRLSTESAMTEIAGASDFEDDVFESEKSPQPDGREKLQTCYAFGTHLTIDSAEWPQKQNIKRVKSLENVEIGDPKLLDEDTEDGVVSQTRDGETEHQKQNTKHVNSLENLKLECSRQFHHNEDKDDTVRSQMNKSTSVVGEVFDLDNCKGKNIVKIEVDVNPIFIRNEGFDGQGISECCSHENVAAARNKHLNPSGHATLASELKINSENYMEDKVFEEESLCDREFDEAEASFECFVRTEGKNSPTIAGHHRISENEAFAARDRLKRFGPSVEQGGTINIESGRSSTVAVQQMEERFSKSETSIRIHTPNNSTNHKLEVTLLIMLAAFLVCFVPSLIMIFFLNSSAGSCELRHWMRDLSFIFAVANSVMNPFIYAWRLPLFRKAIRILLCKSAKNEKQPRLPSASTVF